MRIVSLAASNTEILYALGLADRVVAVDEHSDYPPDAMQKPRVGGYDHPDIEQIAVAAPDLILAAGIHANCVPNLESHGFTVLVIAPRTLDDTLRRILLIGRITGRAATGHELARSLRSRIDRIAARLQTTARPRVFFEISPELYTAGPGSFVNDMIEHAGGRNIAAGASGTWPQLSPEAVVLRNPEVILLMNHHGSDAETADGIRQRPAWRTIAAVKSGRIVVVDPNVTMRPGPRIADGLETLARALHPGQF
jgi:iron complex transport system substrate-binding protein